MHSTHPQKSNVIDYWTILEFLFGTSGKRPYAPLVDRIPIYWVKCPVNFEAKNLHGHMRTFLKACLNQMPFPIIGFDDIRRTYSDLVCGCGVEVKWGGGQAQNAEMIFGAKRQTCLLYNGGPCPWAKSTCVSMDNNKAWCSWQPFIHNRRVKFYRSVKSDAENVWPRSWIWLAPF